MNPLTKIPAKYRLIAYYGFGFGSLVVIYLSAKGIVGVDEITLWTGVGALFSLTASSNITPDEGD